MNNFKWVYLVISIFFLSVNQSFGAHILEPLGTEIPATAPRYRTFGQIGHDFSRFRGVLKNKKGAKLEKKRVRSRESASEIEIEMGLGERTQFNLEWEILWEEKEAEKEEDELERTRIMGLEEFAFGIKHRFLDETYKLPDAGLILEYSPPVGLKDTHGISAVFLASKNITSRLFIPVNLGYGLENNGKSAHSLIYNFAFMWRLLPDELIPLVEFNGRRNFTDLNNKIVAVPEVVWVLPFVKNVSLKFGVPIGLNNASPDWGIRFALAKLF